MDTRHAHDVHPYSRRCRFLWSRMSSTSILPRRAQTVSFTPSQQSVSSASSSSAQYKPFSRLAKHSARRTCQSREPRRHSLEWLLLLLLPCARALHFPVRAMPLPRGPRRTPSPAAVDVEVLIAGGILAAAGWLQWSVSSGEQGINAFLMKEKQDNPFYNGKYKPEGTTAEPGGGGPSWLRRLRLPSLPYVEVYGEAAGQAGGRGAAPPRGGSSRSRLYAELDAAIDREDYAAAKLLKERIDDEAAARATEARDGPA